MADREYVCAYPHCLHHGEKVKSSDSVVISKKHYHWDCAAMKQVISEIRDTYIKRIDENVNSSVLSKVLNDLIFKYELNTEYIEFAINYYADHKYKIKSPFTLLYLRENNVMKKKWGKSEVVDDC